MIYTAKVAENASKNKIFGIGHNSMIEPITVQDIEAEFETVADSWATPIPLKKTLRPVPTLDATILPDAIREWLADIAYRKQAPLDFAASTALTLLSGLVGNRVCIRPKQYDDWAVVPNLWGVIVGAPSMLKTPVMSDVSKPFQRLEKEAREAHRTDRQEFDNGIEFAKIEKERTKAKFKKDGSKEDYNSAICAIEDPTKPSERRYIVNDSSIEKLGIILNENPTGLNIIRDELMGLLTSWERAGHEQDRAFYLEAWNGNGSFSVDRVSRESLYIPKVCLSLFGGIQPQKLCNYFAEIGAASDGMIQRFQLLVYPDPLPVWDYVDRYPNQEAKAVAWDLIEKMASFDFSTIAIRDRFDEDLFYLHFDSEAQTVFIGWLTDLEARLRSGVMDNLVEEHLGKYRSLVPSLALIFHLCDVITGKSNDNSIGVQSLNNAIRYADYLEEHAMRVYELLADRVSPAETLLERIKVGKLGDSFTVRTIQRNCWTGLDSIEKIEGALQILIDHNVVKQEATNLAKKAGRPAAAAYKVNPEIFENM